MSIEIGLIAVDPQLAERVESDYAASSGFPALRDAAYCHLHKAWHAIHFLLTGSDDEPPLPEGYLLDGGVYLDRPDMDETEASPRLLSPDDVKAFAEVLRPWDEQELRRRFDHSAMLDADIYSIGPYEEGEFE
jgi:hypothetical protein